MCVLLFSETKPIGQAQLAVAASNFSTQRAVIRADGGVPCLAASDCGKKDIKAAACPAHAAGHTDWQLCVPPAAMFTFLVPAQDIYGKEKL